MIEPSVLARAAELAADFRAAAPFRHAVIDGFLQADLCRALLADFPQFDVRHARNEMGEVGGKAVRMDVRDISDAYRTLDAQLQTREFLDFVSTVTGIPDLLYDPDYVGGGTHENCDGQSLDQHVDFNFHPGTRWHRRLNLIVYLNPEWDPCWGGNLELQTDPWNGDTRGPVIAPLFNRAVIFETTENSWHGFSTIRLPDERRGLSRKSFAIYLYTRARPPQETAAAHATVYVPDGMPRELVPGTLLDAARHAELRDRFARLQAQLKFLYQREQQFARQIAALEGAVNEARAALRVPLQGYATQAEAPSGMWPDAWIGRELHATFVPQRAVRGLELELWVPEQLPGEQQLEIACGDKRWSKSVAPGAHVRLELPATAPADAPLELCVRAAQVFVPAALGQSGDDRELAWRLLGVSLIH